ncbi:MAG: ABC transporter permease [Bacteroidales bacterium]|jgi:ABC-2 type transport system permease protein|nr:ABC transporter permease [Bacteroidales bacterium]
MNFNKIGIILGREYSVRVKKRSFILTTILTPVLLAALFIVPTVLMFVGGKDTEKVMVQDSSGIVVPYLESSSTIEYVVAPEGTTLEQLKVDFNNLDVYALVGISELDSANNVQVVAYSAEPLNVDIKSDISRKVNKAVESMKLSLYNISDLDRILAEVKSDVQITTLTLTDEGEKEESAEIYMALSYIMSLLIYMFIFMFGNMVMRGVIEEKSGRIVEVIVSSVKSVELMIGKILGIALVALTQFLIWVVLTLVLVMVAGFLMGGDIVGTMEATDVAGMGSILKGILEVRFGYILSCFLIYFVLGYLLYAGMFAAVGAAVDNEADTTQLSMPVTIPLILGLFLMIPTFQNPTGQLAFWSSIIPFTSPMVMMARIPFGVVPFWELALSILLLFATFLLMAVISAKIYKVGILTYGKKASFKDLWKWVKTKN